MTDPFGDRLDACRETLEDAGATAAVLFPSPNLAYLTGFDESPSERHLLLVVPASGTPAFVAPEMYADQLSTTPVADVRRWADGDDPVSVLAAALADRDVDGGRVLVDDRMWATFSQDLRSVLPAATFGLASEVLVDCRIRKDEAELAALARAGEVADRVLSTIRDRGAAVVGTTERELAAEIDRLLVDYGGIEPAFETIVAAGPNGARPHHHPGDREIRAGEPVVLDFGAFVEAAYDSGTGRYPGDQTRTIVFDGDPPAAYETVHGVVREAQAAAIDAVEPGLPAAEIDRIAREVIEDAGYGDAFVHRTGHGVGLEVHEPPYVTPGNERSLEPGMVFSVEPGVYLDGEFGVRIEDLVVVTAEGARRLNDTSRDFRAG